MAAGTCTKSYFGFFGRPIHKPVTTVIGVTLGGFAVTFGAPVFGASTVGSAVVSVGTQTILSITASAVAFSQAFNRQNGASETEVDKFSFLNTDLNTIDDFLKTYSHTHLTRIKDYLNSMLSFSDKTMREIDALLNSMEKTNIKEEKMSKIIGIITILFDNFNNVEEPYINNSTNESDLVTRYKKYKSVINRLIKPEIIIFRIMRELFINSLKNAKVKRYDRFKNMVENGKDASIWARNVFSYITYGMIHKQEITLKAKKPFKGGKRTKRKNSTTKSRRRVVLKKKEMNAIA
jgi:hypothetical protein